MMIANILIPLDGSRLAERALPYAAALAGTAHARLRLVHMLRETPSLANASVELDAAARIEFLASQWRAKGVQATARVIAGRRPADTILSAAAEPPADMIVMSTHGRGGVGRWLYGSVADEVLQQSDVPVLLVPPACAHPWPADRRPKLLLPLDGSDLSEAALGPARLLAHTLGGDLLMMRVVEHGDGAGWEIDPVGVAIKQSPSEELRAARHYLNGLATSSDPAAPPVDVLVEEGDPSWIIPTTARQEGADLIIMATHGLTGLPRLTMGSVATTTVQRAHVPILLIRPPGLERPAHAPDEPLQTMLPEIWPPLRVR